MACASPGEMGDNPAREMHADVLHQQSVLLRASTCASPGELGDNPVREMHVDVLHQQSVLPRASSRMVSEGEVEMRMKWVNGLRETAWRAKRIA